MKPFWGNRIRTIFQETSSSRGVETNVGETAGKSSVKFECDLWPSQRPELFTHSFVTDPDNYLYLKFIQKRRKNRVDTDHYSRVLMERALKSDKLFAVKSGLKLNKPYDHDALGQNFSFQASTEIATNFSDISYQKTKFFTRFITSKDSLTFSLCFHGGYLQNLLDKTANPIPVNDTFYLKNFKGIRNIGYHFNSSDKTKGLVGENLGFDRYLCLSGKLLFASTPLLRSMNIEPFIHANLALAPSRL